MRVGDTFESGVLVSAPDAGATPLAITVKATVTPPGANATDAAARRRLQQAATSAAVRLLPEDPTSRSTALSAARQQREVRFRFSAAAVGAAGLRFDVYVNGAAAAADSAEYDLEVLGRQGEVFIATSLALQPGAGAGAQPEGLELPEADAGSGAVDLVAGVGNLPYLQVRAGCACDAHMFASAQVCPRFSGQGTACGPPADAPCPFNP